MTLYTGRIGEYILVPPSAAFAAFNGLGIRQRIARTTVANNPIMFLFRIGNSFTISFSVDHPYKDITLFSLPF